MAKTRIQFKTDKTANWSESFIPLAGELCIFSDYEDTGKVNHLGNKIYIPNIKVGMGTKEIEDISFLNLKNDSITSEQIESLFKFSSRLGNFRLGYSSLGMADEALSPALEEGQLNYMILA